MSYIATSFFTAFIIIIFQRITKQKKPPVIVYNVDAAAWKTFIEACCNSCLTKDHCYITYDLLNLFSIRYREEIPTNIFNEWMAKLETRIYKKFQAIKTSDPTEITIDHLVN